MALNQVTKFIYGHPDWHGTSLRDYEEWVDSTKQNSIMTIFRGQRKYRPLLPGISRNSSKNTILINEKILFEKFKKEAECCLHRLPETDWDWLVVAQHHGLPTRLLDWSHDPYVALWFAIERAHKIDSKPEVWSLKPEKTDIISSLDKAIPFMGKRTKIFNTSFSIPRIRAQKGCFSLFKYVGNSSKGFAPLERNIYLRKGLERFRLAPYSVKEISKQLTNLSYTKNTLFPDIDEIAKRVTAEIKSLAYPQVQRTGRGAAALRARFLASR